MPHLQDLQGARDRARALSAPAAPVTVALDALGGDHGPVETVAGALAAVETGELRVLLCGPADALARQLAGAGSEAIEIVDAPDAIGSDEEPAFAVRAKPGSSLVTCCRLVREGRAQAAVSAGSTGAMLAASLVEMRRLPGVLRPGIAQPLPSQAGTIVLIDCGANADCKPEHLVQFAHMGSAFAAGVLGIAEPSVGLLSIGEEPTKGNALTLEAHALLAEATGLRFVGNVEGRDLARGTARVVVTDGFTGNVALKLMEGTAGWLLGEVRTAARSSLRGKLGGLLLRPSLQPLRQKIDPEVYGGAYLIGLRGISVIAHGASTRVAIRNALLHAAHGAANDVVGRLREQLARPLEPSGSA